MNSAIQLSVLRSKPDDLSAGESCEDCEIAASDDL